MQASLTCSTLFPNREKKVLGWEDIFRDAAEGGFRCVDISFPTKIEEINRTILSADWKQWARELASLLKKYGLTAVQSHATYWTAMKPWAAEAEKLELYKTIISRCVDISALLDIPWVVVHPLCAANTYDFPMEKVLDVNERFYLSFLPAMKGTDTGVAIENLYVGELQSARHMMMLGERLDSEKYGYCWDTGHANITRQDQSTSIRMLGDRLKATHINDNRGAQDEHLLPYMGNVPWEKVTSALAGIGYRGAMNYEAYGMAENLPIRYRADAFAYAYRVANDLINESEQQEEKQ